MKECKQCKEYKERIYDLENDDESGIYAFFFAIGFIIAGALMISISFYGPFNNDNVEPLANEICELKFNTTAISYESSKLKCNSEDTNKYTIDYYHYNEEKVE